MLFTDAMYEIPDNMKLYGALILAGILVGLIIMKFVFDKRRE